MQNRLTHNYSAVVSESDSNAIADDRRAFETRLGGYTFCKTRNPDARFCGTSARTEKAREVRK